MFSRRSMNISIGLIKSEHQFDLITLDKNQSIGLQTKDVIELQEQNLDLLLVQDTGIEKNDLLTSIEKIKQFCPIRFASDFKIQDLKNLDNSNIQEIFSAAREQWVLQNNLKTVENLFNYLKHLDKFWPNDRANFFQELWFILKNNMGAQSLTLIYNDLKKGEKENEKNKLIQIKIEGQKVPLPSDGGEIEQKMMADFENDFSHHFQIINYQKEKNELTATFTINQSPVLLFAKTHSFSALNRAVITALIEGINYDKILQ